MCVCFFACLMSTFHMYILRPILPPFPEVGCPKFLEIWNPWGKVLERSGLRIEHFGWELVKNCRVIFFCFFADFHSTLGQNWVHQHNNICVGALNFDPWWTLNLILSHDPFPGLSLVKAPGVKIGCINTTFLVLEHSILTLGALLTYFLANTSYIITSQASHCIGATICIGREIRCLPYAGFFLKYPGFFLKLPVFVL